MKSKIISLIAAGVLVFSTAFANDQQGASGQGGSQRSDKAASKQDKQQGASQQGESKKSKKNKGASAQGGAQQGASASDPAIVKEVQKALESKGYNPGPVDGKMGQKTKDALTKFQREQGIQPTGQIDQQTLAALGVEGQSAGSSTTGSTGSSGSSKSGGSSRSGAGGSSGGASGSSGGSASGGSSDTMGGNSGGSSGTPKQQ